MAKVISKIVLGGSTNDIHDARIKTIEEYPTSTDPTSIVSSKGVINYVNDSMQSMQWKSLSSMITPSNAKQSTRSVKASKTSKK